jgi:hypothetical protein
MSRCRKHSPELDDVPLNFNRVSAATAGVRDCSHMAGPAQVNAEFSD